jgi:hypothetical protein
VRFSVETWAPEYGIGADAERLEDVAVRVDTDVERPLADWAPVVPSPGVRPERILFVDGIRRIDARVWIHDGDRSHVGVCASVAAGVVACAGERAEVVDVLVDRGLFTLAASAGPIVTRHATYGLFPTVGDDPDELYLAIHDLMTSLEMRVASGHGCELVVFDGPLRGRTDPSGVGYVKTQRVQYLPDEVVPVLGRLGDGERTPVFLIGGGRGHTRFSWYLRLPGPRSHPLSGIVRCELPGVGTASAAVGRAELVSACLPRFASEPHWESRAPQNLYPIAGLEHELRRRLGDQLLLDRSLRIAAADLGG